MTLAIRQTVRVQPSGVIEIRSPELTPGTLAEVIVLLEMPPVLKRPLTRLIGAAKGGFASVAEVDSFIRREREAWDS